VTQAVEGNWEIGESSDDPLLSLSSHCIRIATIKTGHFKSVAQFRRSEKWVYRIIGVWLQRYHDMAWQRVGIVWF